MGLGAESLSLSFQKGVAPFLVEGGVNAQSGNANVQGDRRSLCRQFMMTSRRGSYRSVVQGSRKGNGSTDCM